MKLPSRQWATPLMTGAFLLSAVTGVLLFFHLNTPLNKLAHEYLSWVLLTAAICHILANFRGFLQHLRQPLGQILIGLFALLLVASFYSRNDGPRNLAAPSVRTLAGATIAELASLSRQTPEQIAAKLQQKGFTVNDFNQTIEQFSGPGFQPQSRLLADLLADTAAPHKHSANNKD